MLEHGRVASFPVTVKARDKYGKQSNFSYVGRVFIIEKNGYDRVKNTETGEEIRGTYYDAWRNLTDWVRLDAISQNKVRHVYDPGYGFREKIADAHNLGQIAWD